MIHAWVVVASLAGRLALPDSIPPVARVGTSDSTQQLIARALAAGPSNVAKGATVAVRNRDGTLTVLRKGTNDFTCLPGDPNKVADPALCADRASMKWMSDFGHHKTKPTNTVPGITYMLAGATQRSDSDPYDSTSAPMTIGPHWMIMWPFDPKATGLSAGMKPTGTFIMWAGSPYAHVHVMGSP
jgi:hypothetical protein